MSAPVVEAPDEASAMMAAQRQGSRVEVASLRTPTRAVYANPAGTMTAEVSVLPTRVERPGGWVPVDATVVSRPDGTLGPRAAVGELSLSPGGSKAPLARMVKGGTSLGLFWPGELPVPTIDGATATYPEVLPGVDLVMRADLTGYRQQLVVKTAAAARNPELARIVMPARTQGLRLAVDDDGAIRAVDGAGEVRFAAPPPVMWDSSGPDPSGPATSRSARVRATVRDGSLVLQPDLAFLADPALVFPVMIDPDMHTWEKTNWATILSGKGGTSYWWTSGDGRNAQVGQCNNSRGDCNNIGEAWAYFQFDTGFVAGRHVLGAEFQSVVVHSPSCDWRDHQLFAVSGAQIWPGMTWNSRLNGGLETTVGVPDTCSGWQSVGFGLPNRGNDTFDGIGGVTSYFLKAANGGDQLAWRKYDPAQTRMSVTYNTRPNTPDLLTTDPRTPAPCTWCGGMPYIGDSSIRLISRLSDPDGDQVRPVWHLSVDGSEISPWGGAFNVSGATSDTNAGLWDKDGKIIGWGVVADDGTDSSAQPSGQSFVVDLQAPRIQPDVSGTLYQADNNWHGGVDVKGTFTFAAHPDTSAHEANDIDHYLYGWSDPPSMSVAAEGGLGGSASVSLLPPGDGPRTLYVQSVDRAGHRSPTAQYRTYVRAGNGALAQWSFEGNANDTAFLGDRHGTLSGDSAYVPGAVGNAVRFGPAGGQVAAPNAVRTDIGFTVSAWVRVDDAGQTRTAVSESGNQVAGFQLGYLKDGTSGRWFFALPQADGGTAAVDIAESAPTVPTGTWTHLAGVYDPKLNLIKLYVNGVYVHGVSHARLWNAAGSVRVGNAAQQGAVQNPWLGAVDEVALYDRVLSDDEIRAAVGRANVQVANWRFDDGSGSTARDSVEDGPMAVLQGGATFTDQGAVKGAVQLDGVDDHVATSGPIVHTDQSFSVAAWVKLKQTDAGTYTVLSQDGQRICGFCLQYQGTPSPGRWVFVMPRNDADDPTGFDWVSAPAPPADQPIHLAATYDGIGHTLRLYLNGQLVGQSTLNGGFSASGPFAIGRAKIRGVQSQFVNGWIDEVRVYSRVISPEEVQGIVAADGVTAGTWKLDGNATDSSAHKTKLDGTLGGAPEWAAGQTNTPDPTDLAVKLNGSSWVSAPHALDTTNSFAVVAWARLDSLGGTATVVSQDGAHVSGFLLRAMPDGRWSFAAPKTDGLNPQLDAAESSPATAQVGVWTHLVGLYSKDRKQLELYVNGVLAGSAAHDPPVGTAGDLQLGRGRWNDGYSLYFPGAIDDVSVYGRTLFADEIRTMAGRDLSLVHNWQLDETGGTNAADAVGVRGGTLHGAASFEHGRVGNAVRFEDSGGSVSTAAVDLRTDQSFTVAAWVFLRPKDCDLSVTDQCLADAVSLDGSRTSKFRLGHIVDSDQAQAGKWIFELPESDTDGAQSLEAALSVEPGELNKWVHLVGVYDAPMKKIWLYVNGDRVADGTVNTPWAASGGLQLGRGKVAGQDAEFWPGSVDDVRLYTAAQDKDRIKALYRSYPAEQAPPSVPDPNLGYWTFNEQSGTSAADSSGNGRNATLQGGAGWHPARNGFGVLLDGTAGYAETNGSIVDTEKSFSAAVWAYPTKTGGLRTVLGQDGNQVSTFAVQYRPSDSRWVVRVPTADAPNPVSIVLTSTETAVIGQWMHLSVVYDAVQHLLRLYVNGGLSAVQTNVVMAKSTGPLSIGRSKWNGANAEFFGGVLDDVRAFNRVITDGEARKIYDDVYLAPHGYWRFEGTGVDGSWRQNPTTLSGSPSYVDGVNGKALQLDGTSVAATAQWVGAPMIGSFTVSAWAKLTRTDRVQTVLGEDGSRMSGYVLQYRPESNRWVFGAPTQDADGAAQLAVSSPQPPTLNSWTQLTGVYDFPERQLRLYVDGQLAGVRRNMLLWPAWAGFTIGRSKVNGQPAEFFAGAIDEVTTDVGAASDAEIARRATYPAPPAGQFGRFVNGRGDHYTASTSAPAPAGYHLEAALGGLVPAGQSNTRMLYACMYHDDAFTSADPNCEGQVTIGAIGAMYTAPPASPATIPVYRCNTGPDHFESTDPACGGAPQEFLIGYTVAYGLLARYSNPVGWEHISTIHGAPPAYQLEGTFGYVSLTQVPGGARLFSCRDGIDFFTSLDAACEGKTMVASLGWIWTTPPDGLPSAPVYRCKIGSEHFDSALADCERQTVEGFLGYVLKTIPEQTQPSPSVQLTPAAKQEPTGGVAPPYN